MLPRNGKKRSPFVRNREEAKSLPLCSSHRYCARSLVSYSCEDILMVFCFLTKDSAFKQGITLRTPANSKFPRYWPPKNFVGCKQQIDLLENQCKKAFQEVNETVNEARSNNRSPGQSGLGEIPLD